MTIRFARSFALALLAAATAVHADDRDDQRRQLDVYISAINQLVEQGALSRDKADALIRQAKEEGRKLPGKDAAAAPAAAANPESPAAPPPAGAIVRVPYVPEVVKQEMLDELRKEVLAQAKTERWGDPGTLPAWLARITPEADFRLRYELDLFPGGSPPNTTPSILDLTPPGSYSSGYALTNDQDTRNRLRMRARFGFDAILSDQINLGIRIASGGASSGSNPVSENQTLGNYDERDSVGLDRAYIRYRPLPWLSFTGGRFANPFFSPTELVWSVNYSPEGLAAKVSHQFGDRLVGVLIAGALPLQLQDNQVISTPGNPTNSKWLFAYQGNLGWRTSDQSDLKFGVAWYDYRHIEGQVAPLLDPTEYDSTQAGFRQGGNSVFDLHYLADEQNGVTTPTVLGLVSKFSELNLSTSLDVANFSPIHMIVDGDYVRNLGFNNSEIFNRTGLNVEGRTVGYQGSLTVGAPKIAAPGDWSTFVGYKHVERDAALDALTDSDFLLGGTNARGYYLGGHYGVAKNTVVGLRWMSGRAIDLPGSEALAINILQIDVAASF